MYKRMKILLYTILCVCLVFYNGITIEAKESKKTTKQVKVIKKSSKKVKMLKKKLVKKEQKPQKTVFKITPKSKNYDDRLTVFKGDEYGLVRSYVDELKRRGGGTLILRKGTYRISKPIYISSNTTIILGDGVVIKKAFDERVRARSIFQFVDRNKIEQMQSIMGEGSLEMQIKRIQKKNEKLLYKKYSGVKNSSLIGKGNATIDLRGEQDALAVVIGHCRNLKIQGITFKNSNSNHFIELDATDTITISDCTFQNAKKSEGLNKEAINLDTPDLTTKGFNCFWSSQDKTPNKNVVIKNCHFSNLERGIGTHQFSANKYHTNIKIAQCTFDKVSVPIFGLNWRNVQIANNDMQTIRKIGSIYDGNSIFLAGVKEVTIRGNSIQDFQQPYIKECYNVSQHYYPAIYSKITDREIKMIAERNNYYD